MMILFWILIGIVVYYFVKDDRRTGYNKNRTNAEQILKLRYVNGEIDQQTYQRTIEVLNE